MIDPAKAVYCWNPETGHATVTSFPMRHQELPLYCTVGAVFGYWSSLSNRERQLMLMVEAWQSILRDGISPEAAHAALMQVSGMRELFSDDCKAASKWKQV